jgi:hypothetical protein
MIRALLILFFCVGSVVGQNVTNLYTGQSIYTGLQLTSVASASSTSEWYPTNISACYSWFVAADYITNLSTPFVGISNRIIGSVNLFTNPAGNSDYWPVGSTDSTANNNKTIQFDGSNDSLLAPNHSLSQPFEVWLVMLENGSPNANDPTYFATSSGSPKFYSQTTIKNLKLYAGTQLNGANNSQVTFSNRWQVVRTVFDGARSSIWTNNSLLISGDAGSANGSALVMGENYTAFASPSKYKLAELATFNATNSTANCSNLNYYFTNKYAIAQ